MKRYMVISDLTHNAIMDDSEAVTIAVLKHPDLEQAVQLDASAHEAGVLRGHAKSNLVIVELISDGGDKRESLILSKDDFESAFTVEDVQSVLEEAEDYRPGGSRSAPVPARTPEAPRKAAKSAADKVNYKELPHAGMPHRGRTTEEEAQVVRENLEEVNKNRVAAGHPEIDLSNQKDVDRYGLHELAKKAGISPAFSG